MMVHVVIVVFKAYDILAAATEVEEDIIISLYLESRLRVGHHWMRISSLSFGKDFGENITPADGSFFFFFFFFSELVYWNGEFFFSRFHAVSCCSCCQYFYSEWNLWLEDNPCGILFGFLFAVGRPIGRPSSSAPKTIGGSSLRATLSLASRWIVGGIKDESFLLAAIKGVLVGRSNEAKQKVDG